MRVFLSIKFNSEEDNRKQIEEIISGIESSGAEVFCFCRDRELWGETMYRAEELMELTLAEIDKSDVLVADVTDWPISVGVEAGYAFAKGKPIICVCQRQKRLATSVTGLTPHVIRYTDAKSLGKEIASILKKPTL
ncbi:MAG TPA: nucleoside 2-deoxyribosyltransferase [Dehalococcoidales bacterium]|nr:nucleoside 2-deoxyribosyltransferase [Dehalococcoidales bacterium]